MTARLPDWPERLAAAIEHARYRRFAWGRHDCALFAADLVLAQTGVDPAEGWRGAYRNARAARRLLRARIGDAADLTALVDRIAAARGWPRIAPRMAGRGDVVLLRRRPPMPTMLGVCVGDRHVCPARAGLVFRPADDAVVAWGIGRCRR